MGLLCLLFRIAPKPSSLRWHFGGAAFLSSNVEISGNEQAQRVEGSAGSSGWPVLCHMSRAKRIARPTSIICDRGKDMISGPIFFFETVCR